MAISKRIDDWLGLGGIGGLDWKTLGGGGGGGGAQAGTSGGWGTAIAGALAAAALAAGATAGNKSSNNPKTDLPTNPKVNSNAPDSAIVDNVLPETELPDDEAKPITNTGNINTGKEAINIDEKIGALSIPEKNTTLPKLPDLPEIEDKTSENVEMAIDNTDMLDMLKSLRDEQWQREDEIRNAVWAREDSAYSRAISDLRRAGANPNLVGVNPAASGGGITNATGVDLGMLETALNNEGNALVALLNNEFKGDENTKDRIMQGITSAISLTGQIVMAYLLKKK